MTVPPPAPLVVVTNWGIAAVPLLGGVLLACAVGAVAYWRALRRTCPVSLKAVCAAAAVALAAAWFVPVLFSSDVYAYAAYGEIDVYKRQLSLYANVPKVLAYDDNVRPSLLANFSK